MTLLRRLATGVIKMHGKVVAASLISHHSPSRQVIRQAALGRQAKQG